jgi:5-methylcytosine-specific restriction protein A
MSFREKIQLVLSEYLQAQTEPFTKHPLAEVLRKTLPDIIEAEIDNKERLFVKGSAGKGGWAKAPCIGIYDPIVTDGAQNGYYVAYIFPEDMSGIYLTLNQGMTEAKQTYKSDAKSALRARAANFRAMLGNRTRHFSLKDIDLAPSKASNFSKFYEAGNICAIFYPTDQLPDDIRLKADLAAMIELYKELVFAETYINGNSVLDLDEPEGLLYEDASKFRYHKRIDRSKKNIESVKKLKGFVCEVCNFDFEKIYGKIGKGYIEAHHLIPISSIKGDKVAMDPKKDFAVLCSNCHRMIHRSDYVDDIEKFKQNHYKLSQ